MADNSLKLMDTELRSMMKAPLKRRAFLAAVPFLLQACASSKHRYREGDNSQQSTSMSVEDERRMSQEYLPKMKKDYPQINNPELQNYINKLGQKIVHSNNLQNNPYNYQFSVVDVPYVNAFALPAGTVFITAPLISMAETEAELSGVVGHEIGHIKARHTAERIDKAEKEKGKSLLYAIGGGILGGAAGFGLGKLLCQKQDSSCLKRAAAYGSAAGIGGGLLVQKYAFMANSREDEMEADRIGFRTSVKSGYDRSYVGNFYEKLLIMENKHKSGNTPLIASITDAMSTHPPSKERVRQMNEMVAKNKHIGSGIISSKNFEKAQQIASQYGKKKRNT